MIYKNTINISSGTFPDESVPLDFLFCFYEFVLKGFSFHAFRIEHKLMQHDHFCF